MENTSLLESASKSLETLNELKTLAVKIQEYELGAKCREIEQNLYPVTDEETNAKKLGEELNLLFRMVSLNIDPQTCYTIYKVLETYKKKKGKVDLKEACDIRVKSESLFVR